MKLTESDWLIEIFLFEAVQVEVHKIDSISFIIQIFTQILEISVYESW